MKGERGFGSGYEQQQKDPTKHGKIAVLTCYAVIAVPLAVTRDATFRFPLVVAALPRFARLACTFSVGSANGAVRFYCHTLLKVQEHEPKRENGAKSEIVR